MIDVHVRYTRFETVLMDERLSNEVQMDVWASNVRPSHAARDIHVITSDSTEMLLPLPA